MSQRGGWNLCTACLRRLLLRDPRLQGFNEDNSPNSVKGVCP